MTARIDAEALESAFQKERDIMGLVYALYELAVPGFDRERNGTSGGHPACSPETWDLVEEAVERWLRRRRKDQAGLRKAWPWASLDFGFREDPSVPPGEVDLSAVTVTDR